MTYDYLIELFKKSQTNHIKPVYFPDSCAPDQIPEIFGRLIPDIFDIIERNFSELSQDNSLIGIFGLQRTCVSLIHAGSECFCCTLFYIPVNSNNSKEMSWSSGERLIIDFSRGIIMDEKYYLEEIFKSGFKGKKYGMFDSKKLKSMWRDYESESYTTSQYSYC